VKNPARFYFTPDPGDRLIGVITPAAGAFVCWPQKCHANSAVHSTRGDQVFFHLLFFIPMGHIETHIPQRLMVSFKFRFESSKHFSLHLNAL
jgi:hypothetical protein